MRGPVVPGRMNFVIVGTGRVGLRTARVLDDEGHAVTVVERDPVLVERARDNGFSVVTGDGSRESGLDDVRRIVVGDDRVEVAEGGA